MENPDKDHLLSLEDIKELDMIYNFVYDKLCVDMLEGCLKEIDTKILAGNDIEYERDIIIMYCGARADWEKHKCIAWNFEYKDNKNIFQHIYDQFEMKWNKIWDSHKYLHYYDLI